MGGQSAACSMVQMLTTASFIPPTLPQKKGERPFAVRLSCPTRERGPTAATPPRCKTSSLLANSPRKKGYACCRNNVSL